MDKKRDTEQLVSDLATAHLVKYVIRTMETMPSDQLLALVDQGTNILIDRDVFDKDNGYDDEQV